VMGTGHHAAVAAKVGPGKTVAVVGDGAVGLCGVIAAKRLGAVQIVERCGGMLELRPRAVRGTRAMIVVAGAGT